MNENEPGRPGDASTTEPLHSLQGRKDADELGADGEHDEVRPEFRPDDCRRVEHTEVVREQVVPSRQQTGQRPRPPNRAGARPP